VRGAVRPECHRDGSDGRGGGFDYRDLPDPTLPDNRLLPRGRGLFLIRQLVDEVRFNATGNSICMILRRA